MMKNVLVSRWRKIQWAGILTFISLLAFFPASAQSGAKRTIKAESYTATIWIDPDGCEHWVFDDGAEGYMSPHLTRDGRPVCHDKTPENQSTCAVLKSDQLFAAGQARISARNRASLSEFFAKAPAKSFIIAGHTDSRGREAYNLKLSQKRANAVAAIAQAAGADIFDVQAYGESRPKASNRTAAGRAVNRRVEVICMY
jgi:outer membrane protein OmpA-like peptidoglycan-associated protein